MLRWEIEKVNYKKQKAVHINVEANGSNVVPYIEIGNYVLTFISVKTLHCLGIVSLWIIWEEQESILRVYVDRYKLITDLS